MSIAAAKDRKSYESFNAVWCGIELTIRHAKDWSAGYDHIEVISADRVPLSITETGYRSLFIVPERLAEHRIVVDYVLAWLDEEANTEAWQCSQRQSKQLSLF
ncbi:hypothetical protein [Maritalea sp.]|uniref:hypothetical protein n=1 Tax=Maritalea sp. TaxID=2003361 RepID=UPI003EF24001